MGGWEAWEEGTAGGWTGGRAAARGVGPDGRAPGCWPVSTLSGLESERIVLARAHTRLASASWQRGRGVDDAIEMRERDVGRRQDCGQADRRTGGQRGCCWFNRFACLHQSGGGGRPSPLIFFIFIIAAAARAHQFRDGHALR